jgi:hypothetical protein
MDSTTLALIDQIDALTLAATQAGAVLQALINTIEDSDGSSINDCDLKAALHGVRALLDGALEVGNAKP